MTSQRFDQVSQLFATGDYSVAGEMLTALGEHIAWLAVLAERIEHLADNANLPMEATNEIMDLLRIVRDLRGR